MEKKSHIKVFKLKLCASEKAIFRSLCISIALLVISTAFSGFCFTKATTDESVQIKSTAIDLAFSAENNAIFQESYNTLNSGTGNTIADEEDIKASKDAIGSAVEDMYSAAVSLNIQKTKMMSDAQIGSAIPTADGSISDITEKITSAAVTTAEPTFAPVKSEATAVMTVSAVTTEKEITAVKTTAAAAETDTVSAPAAEDKVLTAAAAVNTISVKTPPSTLMLDENGIPVKYKKVLTGNASAYSGDGSTATGTVPVPGSIAVNPNIIPYGTKMWIVSSDGKYVYGYAVAEDTGGFIHWSNAPIADLFFTSESACNAFGRRNIKIYILE